MRTNKNSIINHYRKATKKEKYLNRYLPKVVEIIYDLIEVTALGARQKKNVYFAFGYLIHEADDMPEASLGSAGYYDDYVICLHVINSIVNVKKYGKEVILGNSNIKEKELDKIIAQYDIILKKKRYLKDMIKKYF